MNCRIHPSRISQAKFLAHYKALQRDPRNIQEEIRRCGEDFYYFLTGYVWTQDEKDELIPAKRFPVKDYHKYVVQKILEEDLLFIIKTRQLMMSWLACALVLWDTRFHTSRRDILHSLNKDKAAELIDRIWFIYERLPWFLKDPSVKERKDITQVDFKMPQMSSVILALPKGPDAILGGVTSRLIEDESQSQERFRDCLAAALPTIKGQITEDGRMSGGQIIGIGTARPCEFMDMVRDADIHLIKTAAEDFWSNCKYDLEKAREEVKGTGIEIPMVGIRTWKTNTGYFVIELHYSSDPDKNPATEAGARWREYAPKGMEEWQWRREYGIDPAAGKGSRIFSTFNRTVHDIKQKDFKSAPGLPILRCVDFGRNYPAGVLLQFDDNYRLVITDEFLRQDMITRDFLCAFDAYCKSEYPGRVFYEICDEAGNKKNDISYIRNVDFLCSIFGKIDFYQRSVDPERIALMTILLDKKINEKPALMIIGERCPKIIAGFLSGYVLDDKKDGYPAVNHPYIDLFDALGYGVVAVTDPVSGELNPPGYNREDFTSKDDDEEEYSYGPADSGDGYFVGAF